MHASENLTRSTSALPTAVWLEQFDQSDKWVPSRLLEFFRYYDVIAVTALLQRLGSTIFEMTNSGPDEFLYIPSGEVASSASLVTYLFRQVNRIPKTCFVGLEQLRNFEQYDKPIIVLDDFAGSGHSAIRLWEAAFAPIQKLLPSCKIIFACIVAQEMALHEITSRTGFRVVAAEVIPTSQLPFVADSVIFSTENERAEAKSILQKYSPVPYSLGYAETQSLVAFFFNTPDNTIPIFWAETEGWQPLCRYGSDLAAFTTQVVSGRGEPRRGTVSGTPIITELDNLDAVEIESDQAIAVLEELPYNALKIFEPIIGRLQINGDTLRRIFATSHQLQHLTHEQHPVSTSLLIVPNELRDVVATRCFVTPSSFLTLRNDSAVLASLASVVDGVWGGVVATANGEVIGCMPYSTTTDQKAVLERLAPISQESYSTRGLAFAFAGSGRVTLIANGIRLLAHRNSKWDILHPDPIGYLATVEQTADVAETVLKNAYKFAMRMSDAGHGTIMMIGDHENVLSCCDTRRDEFDWRPVELANQNWTLLEPLAKQDGALLITREGLVLGGKHMLRPPVEAEADIPPGAGARHSSAAKMTAFTDAIAVVVSSDGPVTMFRRGRILLSDVT